MTPSRNNMALWHLLAVVTVAFWGTSFVSTKVLLNHGFSAVQIFTMRFVVTYLLLLAASHKQFRSKNWKHELILFICGITGCTLYFWTENTALSLAPSSNVSLIVCITPLLIMIFGGLFYKSERLGKRQILGCFITFIGMVLVVLNGKFILKLSPLGDFLAISAALVWTIYSLVVRKLNGEYSTLFITRKLFFYGVLSALPLLALEDSQLDWNKISQPAVWGNLLYLGLICSMAAYFIWGITVKRIGAVRASNYFYLSPIISMIAAAIWFSERTTVIAYIGCALILAGVVIAEKFKRNPANQ